jgi:penicillin G amidase
MATIFRWLLRLFIVTALLAIAAVVVLYWFFARSIPDYSASWESDGISGTVEIVRDNASVPHIYGGSDEDVYFGLGFAHAQDRLWQMTMFRRTAQGRLSEIFGERTLRIDELVRRLDLYALAASSVAAQDDYTKAALEAYARGVNAWLDIVNREALGRGAPEFWLFAPELAPWTPADSIALGKLMALRLSEQLQNEVLRAQVSLVLPEARVRDILPDAPGEAVIDLPEFAALFPDAPKVAVAEDATRDPLAPAPARGFGGASNAWAAAPSRSAAGGTLLASDPHLAFSAPSIWYLAALDLRSGGVIGATIPGTPAVLAGRSERLGWAPTSSYLDDQDLYIERLNPENPAEVLTPEGFRPLRTRASIINVKDAAPVTIALQWSENGPILPADQFDLASITPPGHVVSLAWTGLSAADTSASSALALMRAGSVEEAIAAGEGFIAPSQNWTLVDQSRIAMQMVGAQPRRAARHQSQGRIPTPGWLPENRWQGSMDYAANPSVVDPVGGILGNTNNKITDQPFPFHVSHHWGDTQRIQRWRRLMQAREVHTRESFIEAQLDTVSFSARSILPLIGANLWYTGDPAPEGTPERLRQQALGLLAEWNGEMNEHMPEPLLYAAWVRALQERLIRDELGPLARSFTRVEPLFLERVYRDVDGAAVWCDIIQSDAIESCEDIARLALDDALLRIGERYGTNLESLRWGDVHQATHDHEVLGTIPGLGLIVNIRQSTSGGDQTLMRGQLKGTGPDPYLNSHGAGYRGVYDFADPDSSVFIVATGQSGHPLSRHYDDLGELWRRGEYIPMSLNPELARAAAVGVTVIAPAAP